MELLLAIVAGVLYASGIYMMLRRRLAQLIIGLGLLSNGTNMLIFRRRASRAPGRRCHRRTGGRSVRRPCAAVARPHRDRDRVRRPRVLARAGRPRARHGSDE